MDAPLFSMGIDPRTKWQKHRDKKYRIIRSKIRECYETRIENYINPLYRKSLGRIKCLFLSDAPEILQHLFSGTHSLLDVEVLLVDYMQYKQKQKQKTVNNFFQPEEFVQWFQTYQSRRFAFRKCLLHWLLKRAQKNALNTEDPCTLESPKELVRVYAKDLRGHYRFEAQTLYRSFHAAIGFHDWQTPKPLDCKNPFTNTPFTLPQWNEIMRQLRYYNKTSWLIEARYQFLAKRNIFLQLFQYPLRAYGIEEICRNVANDINIELLSDFLEDTFERHEQPVFFVTYQTALLWAFQSLPNHPYCREWLRLYRRVEYYDLLVPLGHSNPTEARRIEAVGARLCDDLENLQAIFKAWQEWVSEKKLPQQKCDELSVGTARQTRHIPWQLQSQSFMES